MPTIPLVQAPGGSQPPLVYSAVKTGQDTLTLTSQDLRDRIINLRFIHKPKAEGMQPKAFTIRSDYEPQFNPLGGFQYIDSIQKPGITVSLRQVENKTAVNIILDVVNLNISIPEMLDMTSEPLQQVEIQIGYKSQMPDWARDPFWSQQPIQDFYALKDNNVTTDASGRLAPTKIVAEILTAERVSAPPDMVTRFTCVIGTMTTGFRWQFTEASLGIETDQQHSTLWNGREPQNNLPNTFYALVSRRFIKSTIRHNVNETYDTEGALIGQSATIYDVNLQPVRTIALGDGRMTAQDADAYGVTVFLSDTLWQLPLEESPNWNLTDSEKIVAQPVRQPIFADMQDTLHGQLQVIAKQYPYIRYYVLASGDYYAYHVKEAKDRFFADPFTYQQNQAGIFKIPAVYDITWGGTRTIRMPFVSILSTMMMVAFQSRYALNDQVGAFYAPPPGNTIFLVLLIDIIFSTVGTQNMMTLMTTDVDGDFTPQTQDDGTIKPLAPDPPSAPVTRDRIWKEFTIEVVTTYEGDPLTTDGTWHQITRRLLDSAKDFADLWGSGHPTLSDALDALASWNATLFGGSRTGFKVSTENDWAGRYVPVLFSKDYNPVSPGNSDVVTVRYPLLPNASYTTDTKL